MYSTLCSKRLIEEILVLAVSSLRLAVFVKLFRHTSFRTTFLYRIEASFGPVM